MPHSSEAFTGPYNPKLVPEQNYNRAPRQSVNVNVNEIDEIPSTSTVATNNKKVWIIGSLVALAVIGVCAGVATPLIIRHLQSLTVTNATSSTSTLANNASSTTTGSSNSNSTTLSTSSGASTTVSTGSTASTTVSTSSVSSTTTLSAGFTAGGAVAAGTTAYYGYETVTVNCTANLNNITITVYVLKTVGATYSGAYSTFWGGTMNQAYLDNGTQIIYTWTIVSGQTIQASGSPYTTQAQFSLQGTNQLTTADTYIVRATTVGGITSSFSGHF